MENRELTIVYVILTSDYGTNPARVVSVTSSKASAQRFVEGKLGDYYWWEEQAVSG